MKSERERLKVLTVPAHRLHAGADAVPAERVEAALSGDQTLPAASSLEAGDEHAAYRVAIDANVPDARVAEAARYRLEETPDATSRARGQQAGIHDARRVESYRRQSGVRCDDECQRPTQRMAGHVARRAQTRHKCDRQRRRCLRRNPTHSNGRVVHQTIPEVVGPAEHEHAAATGAFVAGGVEANVIAPRALAAPSPEVAGVGGPANLWREERARRGGIESGGLVRWAMQETHFDEFIV